GTMRMSSMSAPVLISQMRISWKKPRQRVCRFQKPGWGASTATSSATKRGLRDPANRDDQRQPGRGDEDRGEDVGGPVGADPDAADRSRHSDRGDDHEGRDPAPARQRLPE